MTQELKQHPQFGNIKTPSKVVEVNGREYTIHLHTASPGSAVVLQVASLFGEPIAEFLSTNIQPLVKWYGKRDKLKKVMTADIGEEAAEADLLGELMELLGGAQVNIKDLTATVMRALLSDATGSAIRATFAFTHLEGEWLVADHYENAFAGRLKDLGVVAYKIWEANGWLDFLSSASANEAQAEG